MASGVLPLRARPGHAARAIPERGGQALRSHRPARRRNRHVRRGGPPGWRASTTGRCRRAKPSTARSTRSAGSFLQQPPAFSAKKIDGRRSYRLRARVRARRSRSGARTSRPPANRLPEPRSSRSVPRCDRRGECRGRSGSLAVDCSAGFYIRSLAHDLGGRSERARISPALRRTRSGGLDARRGLTLEAAEREPERAVARILPLRAMLPDLPSVVLTAAGTSCAPATARARQPADVAERHGGRVRDRSGCWIESGELVGIAEAGTDARHFCIPQLS